MNGVYQLGPYKVTWTAYELPPPSPPPPPPEPVVPTSATLIIPGWKLLLWLADTTPPHGAGPHPAKVVLGTETIEITAIKR